MNNLKPNSLGNHVFNTLVLIVMIYIALNLSACFCDTGNTSEYFKESILIELRDSNTDQALIAPFSMYDPSGSVLFDETRVQLDSDFQLFELDRWDESETALNTVFDQSYFLKLVDYQDMVN